MESVLRVLLLFCFLTSFLRLQIHGGKCHTTRKLCGSSHMTLHFQSSTLSVRFFCLKCSIPAFPSLLMLPQVVNSVWLFKILLISLPPGSLLWLSQPEVSSNISYSHCVLLPHYPSICFVFYCNCWFTDLAFSAEYKLLETKVKMLSLCLIECLTQVLGQYSY